ncbi:hypothetical protein GCM10011519_24790 [Marmoricola endophyticus]|uniref:Chlorophyllase n=1 Tax=Marmoricola endophyticus TaxID=2040280 RepID=A0A917F6Y8_9ACTN|nr:alpha/beta fold hydrolase [Marmoricola endophyticus]GGF49855.1 hypothetical protein GCM10011519_24790 [Marmoricola endophyticus]
MNRTPVPMPSATPAPILSVKPITVDAPDRGSDLQVRVAAPLVGGGLPVVLFAHGFGSSLDLYGPLTDHWAAQGMVVVQPTFLDSRTLDLPVDDPRVPHVWRRRVDDLVHVLDRLGELVATVPGLADRVDPTRVAVAGHSFGGQSAGQLLGLRVDGSGGEPGPDRSDPRVRAGVLLATAGRGGDSLAPGTAEAMPFLNARFDQMSAPALVVAGDHDDSPLTVRGPAWTTDPYHLSPGPKSLLTVPGGEHFLGGIAGYEAVENTDPDPARLALVQRVTTAYLRAALLEESADWERLRAEDSDGVLVSKS